MRDYLQVLGVPHDARASDIRRACRQRSDRAHPDFETSSAAPVSLPAEPVSPDVAVDFVPMSAFIERVRSDFFGFHPSGHPVRVHLDVLGWLHVLAGGSALATAAAFCLLAGGTAAASPAAGGGTYVAAVYRLFLLLAFGLAAGGVATILAGRLVLRRDRRGRLAALALALPMLVIVPFGTSLAIYAFWALLNDDARREFGRPPRRRANLPRSKDENSTAD